MNVNFLLLLSLRSYHKPARICSFSSLLQPIISRYWLAYYAKQLKSFYKHLYLLHTRRPNRLTSSHAQSFITRPSYNTQFKQSYRHNIAVASACNYPRFPVLKASSLSSSISRLHFLFLINPTYWQPESWSKKPSCTTYWASSLMQHRMRLRKDIGKYIIHSHFGRRHYVMSRRSD